jgi:drug/metabolite transporter (DMT)-like permease
MFSSHIGEFAALVTAMSWTIGAMAFELATKRSGSIFVNLMKVFIGFFLLSLFTLLTRGLAFPVDASGYAWFWLSLSGFVGFVLGDLFLFRAFAIIGSRISMLFLASVPPLTALLGWLVLGEQLLPVHLIGMILTVGGIALVVLERRRGEKQFKFSHPISGILMAFGGALGQSVGLIFSKLGMGSYNAFAATQIRVLTGFIGFFILVSLRGMWPRMWRFMKDPRTMKPLFVGSIFGPFIGVSFSLLAVQHTQAGVASTIMAIVPVLIIPPAIVFLREKVTLKEIFGAVIAVCGVAVLFLV